MITSLVIKTIIRPKKNKNERYDNTNISLEDISNIIKEFEKLPYEGYVQKKSKHETTDSRFYLEIQLAKCMRLNSQVGPVRTKVTETKKMNIYDMNTQNIPISCVCYLEKSK